MVLACDTDKPKETQPRIFARQPTMIHQRKLVELLESLRRGAVVEQMDGITNAVMLMVTGWENIPVALSRESIEEVLSMEEMIEIISFLALNSTASADDKKKSGSPPS